MRDHTATPQPARSPTPPYKKARSLSKDDDTCHTYLPWECWAVPSGQGFLCTRFMVAGVCGVRTVYDVG